MPHPVPAFRLGALVLLLASAPAGCRGGTDNHGRDGTAAAPRLTDLAGRYWEWSLETDPIEATYLGFREYDDRLPDRSPEGRRAAVRRVRTFFEELEKIDLAELRGQDRLTFLALKETLSNRLALQACANWQWDVDHRNGPQISFLNLGKVQRAETEEAQQRMVRRWRAMGPYLDQHVANLREGLREGRPPARILVEHVIAQLEGILARPDSTWPLLAPLATTEDASGEDGAFRRMLREAVATRVRPGFQRYLAFLRREALPAARTDTAVGVHSLPKGEECYRAAIRAFTSLDLTPGEVHEFGRAENERIRKEMRQLGQKLFGTNDFARIQNRLRTDPAMHFTTREEVFRKAVEATDRARAAIPAWFGRLPRAGIVVEEIPEYEAPYTTIAYYRQPAVDGSRPGTYFINTWAPTTRPRYDAEVLAFHEGIPGHHLQIAIAQELTGIPEFRKHEGTTAFVEGWALYSERLADEMGLYSGDLDRMGMLSFDAWRASRLVVDTGLHAFGWTREEAIDYMRENTLLAENNIENEVDRYISWPGQALAYKLGQREILALRNEARKRLGARFSISAFHDAVLENGAVSLAVLREIVERWTETHDPS